MMTEAEFRAALAELGPKLNKMAMVLTLTPVEQLAKAMQGSADGGELLCKVLDHIDGQLRQRQREADELRARVEAMESEYRQQIAEQQRAIEALWQAVGEPERVQRTPLRRVQ